MHVLPRPQSLQSLDPRDHTFVVCVAGTRYYNDRRYFHEKIVEFIEQKHEEHPGCTILFVSGAAPSGADDLIIRWCDRFRYPCLKVPADWDTLGPKAGFVRNEKMANMINYLLAFWDKRSNGTGDMVGHCDRRKTPTQIFQIPTPQRHPQHVQR